MSSPCNNSPDEVIEKVVAAKADADKFNKFVNGTKRETVQLGSGAATPVIRNVVAQMQAAAGAAGTYESDLEVVNAKDFGAVDARNAGYTDGVLADNAIAVQAAINNAAANGGTVYIPNGVRYLRSGIDDKGVLVVDDSTGFRVTSRDFWWMPYSERQIKAVAHRGLSAVYPENTVLAFRAAAQQGFYGIETDIQWTSDGYPVCMHDDTVDRTTDGSGAVQSMTLAQVRQLDAGSFVNASFSTCLVPTLEEFLDVCRAYGCAPFIEIKDASNVTQARLQDLVDTVKSYGLHRDAVFVAFTWSHLGTVRAYSSEVGVCGVQNSTFSADNKRYLEWLGGKVYWGPSIAYATKEAVAEMRSCGVATYAWTLTSGDSLSAARKAGCQSVAMNTLLA